MTSITATLALTTSLLSAPAVPAGPAPAAPAPLTSSLMAMTAPAGVDDQAQFVRVIRGREIERPKALMPMYAGFVALQGYDAYSTLKAVRAGGVERNHLMAHAAKSPAQMISVKGAATLSSIWAAERLWRANHRKAAVVLMAVTGGMMAAVAANNACVLRRMR